MPGLASDWTAAIGYLPHLSPAQANAKRRGVIQATVYLLELAERGLLDGTGSEGMRRAAEDVRCAVDAALIGRRTLGS